MPVIFFYIFHKIPTTFIAAREVFLFTGWYNYELIMFPHLRTVKKHNFTEIQNIIIFKQIKMTRSLIIDSFFEEIENQ